MGAEISVHAAVKVNPRAVCHGCRCESCSMGLSSDHLYHSPTPTSLIAPRHIYHTIPRHNELVLGYGVHAHLSPHWQHGSASG